MRKEKTADRIINKLHKLGFPKVSRVRDAEEPIWVNVTKQDSQSGRKKDSSECALARACVREKHADGAVVNIGISYLVKGTTATRYKLKAGEDSPAFLNTEQNIEFVANYILLRRDAILEILRSTGRKARKPRKANGTPRKRKATVAAKEAANE